MSLPKSGVSKWHDTKEVYAKLDYLLSQKIKPIKAKNMKKVINKLETTCPKSKALYQHAQTVIPNGVQHNLAFNYPFAIAMDKAKGAYLRDIDGNQYIDFLQAGGTTLLGSNYQPVLDKVQNLLAECGPVTGLLHQYEVKIAEEVIKHVPSVEMFRMLGSGTESVMAAIRLARNITGKKHIIKVGGGYHGWSDQMVYGLRIPGTGRREAHGIPKDISKYTHEVCPNDLANLRLMLNLNSLRGGTAAVIVEPIGPESGTRPVYFDYNQQVRTLCDEFDTLLIFDEVVSGFRFGLGGAQAYFNVDPDITVFGKCLTGGYPMAGGIGGRKEIMMSLAGGIGGKGGKKTFVGGTLSANPLSTVAGYYAIKEMERTNAAGIAGRAGDRLCAGLEEIIERRGLPYVAYNQGSIVHLETSGVLLLTLAKPIKALRENAKRKHMMEQMGAAYTAHGIISLAGSCLLTSMADTDPIIDEALNRFDEVFALV
ncbi:aminotransferase class III-fold pyridoxal phosphate-dependent enzyme [Psychrobacter frigidicola]|uniref:Aminotransferase class III-fold pyridoxal phosphate-dependent enzyme n=2 Tax=Psychrobacter frigidicola TaxID=45611 RepID=A0A5C7A7S8_9GAMM|nr:aminotransferase class III-fold pyridoxal phosphate-dependent enzyme [Psychrobacter frigidicola]